MACRSRPWSGRADLMNQMEEIFFSSTFGGETLSIAAAIAVADKIKREPVIQTLWKTGGLLADKIRQGIARNGLEKVVSLHGLAPWTLLAFADFWRDSEGSDQDAVHERNAGAGHPDRRVKQHHLCA